MNTHQNDSGEGLSRSPNTTNRQATHVFTPQHKCPRCGSKSVYFTKEGARINVVHCDLCTANWKEYAPPSKTLRRHFSALYQAERFQNRLYDDWDSVNLIESPKFSEAGDYVWRVASHLSTQSSTTAPLSTKTS